MKNWNFDSYDWVDSYNTRMSDVQRLCYEETLRRLPECTGAKAGDFVLDLGCGTGNSTVPFLERGCQVIGLDPSQRMLAQAEEKVSRWQGHFAIQQAEDPFLNIPFPDENFHIVISAYAIHHLNDCEKLQAIQEMKRVLKPGGRIAIADTMFLNEAHKMQALQDYEDLEDEYQPLLITFPPMFEAEKLQVTLHGIGDLIWILVARKDP